MIRERQRRSNRRRFAIALAALAAALLAAPAALAHVERASYAPDRGVDMADGMPTGGEVPQARDLFSALNETAVSQTRVVCQTGEPLPLFVGNQIVARIDQAVSKKQVRKLKRKHRKVRKKMREDQDNEGLKKKAARLKERLTRAKERYRERLEAELQTRGIALAEYQRLLAEDRAARLAYAQKLAADPSIQALDAALDAAVANGYVLRPSEPPIPVSPAEADRLRDFNARLLAKCEFKEIQSAINASDNNDRVVVMPGVYTEPTSRAVDEAPPPEDNPCDGMREQNDRGNTGALSYRYQFHCPNQQNLIAVMGRAPKADPGGPGGEFVPPPPDPADPRRDGIPDEGPCIRCNLQLEGSGISPDDVVVDSGDPAAGDGPLPGGPDSAAKDVGIRIDRADGFVLRNLKVRHSPEHDIYSPETDGLLLERFKTRFNGEYGVLTFVAENHLIQDCDAMGSGDAAIYPGSSAERGEQDADPDYNPTDPTLPHTGPGNDPADPDRYSTEIRRCDMRHSATGYSGTASNSVWVHDSDLYDNAMGFVTDVFTAAGHPGFPQDSDLIEDNEFYSNNFNPYLEPCDPGEAPGEHGPDQGCSDIEPRIPAPIGTGMFLPGVNNNTIRNNHFWDNWRRGTMLFSVPDQFVCGPLNGGNQQHGCQTTRLPPATSHRNEQYGNVMGRSPDHAPDPTWPSGRDVMDVNGVDFWWDEFLGNVRNCWYNNVGPNPDGSGLDTDPPGLPGELIPCELSLGTTVPGAPNEVELLACVADFELDAGLCPWFTTPPEPATP